MILTASSVLYGVAMQEGVRLASCKDQYEDSVDEYVLLPGKDTFDDNAAKSWLHYMHGNIQLRLLGILCQYSGHTQ